MGPTFPFTIVVVQNAVALHQLGVATGTMNFFRALGSTFIVSGFGAIVLAGAPVMRGMSAGAVLAGTDAAEAFRWVFAAAILCLAVALCLHSRARGAAAARLRAAGDAGGMTRRHAGLVPLRQVGGARKARAAMSYLLCA